MRLAAAAVASKCVPTGMVNFASKRSDPVVEGKAV